MQDSPDYVTMLVFSRFGAFSVPDDTYMQDLIRKRRRFLKGLLITAIVMTAALWGARLVFGSVMQPVKAQECQAVLRDIGSALQIYSGEYGSYPEDPFALQTTGTETSCPSAREGTGYVYLRGLSRKAPPDTIIMFDRLGNHTYGRNILYTDGRVIWTTEQVFRFQAKRMTGAPYMDFYPEDVLSQLERISSDRSEEEGGGAVRIFSTSMLLLSMLTALVWIMTFITMHRYMKVVKYRSQKTENS